MSFYTSLVRPVFFQFDPEFMHSAAITFGRTLGSAGWVQAWMRRQFSFTDARLETEVCGIRFNNPLGLAAGWDKSGHAIEFAGAMGFGHVEIGSVSADPSDGNPRPRLWRLPEDRALVVHYGLPNDGADVVARRLQGLRRSVPLGINLVKTNKGLHAPPDCDDAILDDYVRSIRRLKEHADYLTLNLSCPNTEMGREFYADKAHLEQFMRVVAEQDIRCPLFLKMSPTGGVKFMETVLEVVEPHRCVSGFIFNLPPGIRGELKTAPARLARMRGAVSGKPVESLMNDSLRELYARMDRRRYRLMAAGGVFSAEDAYRKIRLGASLVQLITALIYEGPAVIGRINEGLCGLLERDGFKSIADAVGTMP